jgi:hypothetical protein
VRVGRATGAADVLLIAEGVDHDGVLERACLCWCLLSLFSFLFSRAQMLLLMLLML